MNVELEIKTVNGSIRLDGIEEISIMANSALTGTIELTIEHKYNDVFSIPVDEIRYLRVTKEEKNDR